MAVPPPKTVRVSIVGSAGRKGDAKWMNKDLYLKMVEKAKDVIVRDFNLNLENVHLVSGGAAWADHVAVGMYIHGEVPFLTLHLPTEWERSTEPGIPACYHDRGESRDNPGRTANKLHREFSRKIGEDTLHQLEIAQSLGATTCQYSGFQKRNTEVAKSKYLLAFTWGDGKEPKKGGGTRNTWDKCFGRKLHIPLGSLLPASQAPAEKDKQPYASSKNKRTNTMDMFVVSDCPPAKKSCP